MCADGNFQEEFLWAILESEIAGSLGLLDNKLFFQSGGTNLFYQEYESVPVLLFFLVLNQYCQTLQPLLILWAWKCLFHQINWDTKNLKRKIYRERE